MTQEPSKRPMRCYPIECCTECPGLLPMRHLYKPYGMMSPPNIVDIDSEFANRWVCTETEDNREIKLNPSLDSPDWCPLLALPAREDERKKTIDEVIAVLDAAAFHCYPDPHAEPGSGGQCRFLRAGEIYPKIEALKERLRTK